MRSSKITPFSKGYQSEIKLHQDAFPPEELYPFWLLNLMALSRGSRYEAYYEGEKLCGISYTSVTKKMVYLLYLAVDEEIRSRGYGSRIVEMLKEKYQGKEITLNIEVPLETSDNYEQRVKRMDFYYRNGFMDTGFQMLDTTGDFMILSTSEDFDLKEFKKAVNRIGMFIYKPKFVKIKNNL